MMLNRSLSISILIAAVSTAAYGGGGALQTVGKASHRGTPRAVDVLRRSEIADRFISYRGTKVATIGSVSGDLAVSLKVVHQKPDKTRTDFYAPSALAGVILIENGAEAWRFCPGECVWEQARCRGLMPHDAIWRGAFENYDLRLVGTDTVAGRPTYVIHASPKRRSETSHRVWIDERYYVPVATQVESPQGYIVTSSRYTRIEFNPKDISASEFKVNGKVRPTFRNPTRVPFKVSVPKSLPRGYKQVGVSSLSVNGHTSVCLEFSNGVNSISLFERAADSRCKPPAIHSKYTRVLTWTHGDMLYTLIADLSYAELHRIADSIK